MKDGDLDRGGMVPLEISKWTEIVGGNCGGLFIGTKDGLYSVCITAWW